MSVIVVVVRLTNVKRTCPHIGPTIVPAKTATGCLKFTKSFSFKAKVKTVTEQLSFVGGICIENLIIVILLVYGLVN